MDIFERTYYDLILEEADQTAIDQTTNQCMQLVNDFLNNPNDKSAEALKSFMNNSELIKQIKDESEITNTDLAKCFKADVTEASEDGFEDIDIDEAEMAELQAKLSGTKKSGKHGKKQSSMIKKICKTAKTVKKMSKLIFWLSVATAAVYGYAKFGTDDPKAVADKVKSYEQNYDADSASTFEKMKGVYLGADAAATGIRQPVKSLSHVSDVAADKADREAEEKGEKAYDPKEHSSVGNFVHGMTHPMEMFRKK